MDGEVEEEPPDQNRLEPSPQNLFGDQNDVWWDGGRKVKTGDTFDARRLDTPLDQMVRKSTGKRSRTRTERKRGRYVQSRPTPGKAYDLAFDATLRSAAPHQQDRKEQGKKMALNISPDDYMRKVRVRKVMNLVLFVVDASWSMAVAERMTATKGAILSLLTDAYQRRDRVGLVVFQKNQATLVLPPTNSVQLAQRALENIPVGGKTPLSAGLILTLDVLRREKILHPDVMPLVIILTDGAANVSAGAQPPMEEAYQIARQIAREKVHSVVVNMEHAAFDQGLAQALADHMRAQCYTITELKADNLYATVREEMRQMQPGKIEDRG